MAILPSAFQVLGLLAYATCQAALCIFVEKKETGMSGPGMPHSCELLGSLGCLGLQVLA